MLIECYNLAGGFLKNWWVKIILLLDGVLILAVVVAGLMRGERNAVIDFEVAPIDAEVFLNGKSGYTDGEYKVSPGEYQVKVVREGLDTREFSVNVGANEYVTVATFLTKEGGFSYYELKENYADYEELREIVARNELMNSKEESAAAREFVRRFEKAYAIFDESFIGEAMSYADGTGDWRVWGSEGVAECEKTLCLEVVDILEENKDDLQKLISGAGYNFSDYQIVYRNNEYRSMRD